MDQETRWFTRYQEVIDFIETNHRNPSKHRIEEHDMLNWVKQQRKLHNAGKLNLNRVEAFKKLMALIEENKSDEAAKYIRENISIIKSVEPKLFTQNEIVNAVVNSKLSFASAMGIEVSCFSTNDFSGVSNIDWCNLLSNMLDNAVEACLGISEDIDRHIELTISKSDNTYTIIISNTIENSVLAYNPNLRSTKHNSENHGMGTKIIKDIVSKHNGTCLFYENNNEFNCKAILQV